MQSEAGKNLRLITRWQNSAGERVRIALNLKGIAYEYVARGSLSEGEFLALNPQGLLPALEVGGEIIAQSGAILAYLEDIQPDPPLLPRDPVLRAQARAFGAHIACEMHAMTVNRVRVFLADSLGVGTAGLDRWAHHWLAGGMAALEEALARRPRSWPFCFGERPGWGDIHLVPQMTAARRLGCDLSPYTRLCAVEDACRAIEAFRLATAENQPDFPDRQTPDARR